MLWFGNVGLIAGVAAAGWHLMKDVNPATASVLARKDNYVSKSYKKIIDKYDRARMKQSSWQPKPPVARKEVNSVFLEKWSKPKREKPHFPFVGPLPPPIAKKVTATRVKEKLPTGLITVGEPTSLIYSPPSHVMLFEFKSGKSEAFGVGDWIREPEDSNERFKMLDIEGKDVDNDRKLDTFEVVYGVYEDGKEIKREKLGFSNPADRGGDPDVIRDLAKKAVAGVTGGGGTAAAGTEDGNTEISKPLTPTEVVVVGEVTLADAKPEVRRYGSNKRAVVFTEKTYRYFKGKNAAKLAESIKTSVASSGGRTIGLRVTGFGKDLNADVFDVKKGDILVSINGTPVRDRAGVVELVKRLPEKDLVTVVINRNGKLLTYRVDPSDPKNRRRVRYFENVDMPGR